MSPVGNDYNEEEIFDRAANELSAILKECYGCISYEVVINPNRKWFQFWKPKTILKKIEELDG